MLFLPSKRQTPWFTAMPNTVTLEEEETIKTWLLSGGYWADLSEPERVAMILLAPLTQSEYRRNKEEKIKNKVNFN